MTNTLVLTIEFPNALRIVGRVGLGYIVPMPAEPGSFQSALADPAGAACPQVHAFFERPASRPQAIQSSPKFELRPKGPS